jgi:hypothetical protein
MFKDLDVPLLEDVSEDHALRFLALPDKIKRAHFNAEELALLTQSSNRVLRGLEQGRSSTTTWSSRDGSTSAASSRLSDTAGDEREWLVDGTEPLARGDFRRSEPNLLRTFTTKRANSFSSAYSSAYSMASSAVDLTWTSNHSKPSFSRKRPLAPLPLPPPALLPAVPPLPSNPVHDKESTPTPSPTDSTRDTTARYYGDTEARSKLRTFLASPEKFDEALEFGFPAVDLSHDDEDDDLSTSSSSVSPPTPRDSIFTTPHGSVDSGVVLPLQSKKTRSLTPDLDGREMTLRLTLTRRDLRAPDAGGCCSEQQQRTSLPASGLFEGPEEDPLALGILTICDDHTGNHGAFAVRDQPSQHSLRKLWKNIRKRC